MLCCRHEDIIVFIVFLMVIQIDLNFKLFANLEEQINSKIQIELTKKMFNKGINFKKISLQGKSNSLFIPGYFPYKCNNVVAE